MHDILAKPYNHRTVEDIDFLHSYLTKEIDFFKELKKKHSYVPKFPTTRWGDLQKRLSSHGMHAPKFPACNLSRQLHPFRPGYYPINLSNARNARANANAKFHGSVVPYQPDLKVCNFLIFN